MNRRIATVSLAFVLVLAGCTAPMLYQKDSSQAGELKLPGDWSGFEWMDKNLREGQAGDDMRYRNETAGQQAAFVPKKMNNSTLPENEHRRELVKYGRQLFANTANEIPNQTGTSRMSCANCHGGGSLPTANGMVGQDIKMIPLVGTAAGYPEWTGRTSRMRDMRQRIQGCFLRSMNTDPENIPEYDSREIQAMESYLVWLAKGTPVQKVPYWRHIRKPEGSEKMPIPNVNPVRGAKLYLENCASCHGKDGQGSKGQYPPLWGPDSYNDGAGMGRIYTASGFIREAMPYGSAHTVSDWRDVQDIAGFVNGHDRPHLDRQNKDWSADGPPDEAVYYKRVQDRFGYNMNPMRKKLLMAGIPVGTEPLNKGDIPKNTDKYRNALNETSINGTANASASGAIVNVFGGSNRDDQRAS
ncbi:cytochrome c class I [Haladaptatus paucihalophilus DX253]|uniref:Cytochrome c class I n=1 Tax=Haladaptatus paucihalophilus DX253 TaxID=797209 RepID=E7QXA8_HALPU|nr:c-type cytochrome [Haladaptatus paucihalophilus]EFW90911.1 cytochrome c class I [Haladaptatus paucihalophilus DX253]SHK25869.1 thiosulfate dehydrogenase [Haladaptatus paucihalophilus DX253]